MKVAIMQPYLFPYIGYWQLINAVDTFVLLDDVNFIKRGYINRTRILINGQVYMFSVPIKNASQNCMIKDTKLSFDDREKRKFLARIEKSYKKAPYYQTAMSCIEKIITNDTDDLTEYIRYSIEEVINFFKMKTRILRSSEIDKDNLLRGQDRIVELCKCLRADIYINASGGRILYESEVFKAQNIELFFLDTKMDRVKYHQFCNDFVGNLSIIDVMMFNSCKTIHQFLKEYDLNR